MCKHNDYSLIVEILKLVTEKNINSTKFPTISNEESYGQCLSQSSQIFLAAHLCSHPITFSYMILNRLQKQELKTMSTGVLKRFAALTISLFSFTTVF